MARDWDLFSLAAAPLTFFGITIARQWFELFKDFSIHKFIIGICIAPTILSCTNFYINSRYDYSSRRLESIGEWSYRSYYWGASYLITVGEKAIKDTAEQIARRKEIIEKLLPYKSTPDYEVAYLYRKIGEAYMKNKQNDLAIQYFQKTLLNDSTQIEVIKWTALVQLFLWRFDEADRTIEDYNIKVNHPAVNDFVGLLMAQEINYLRLLKLTKIDSFVLQARMDKIVSFQSVSK
jgi:tetratricopeptide (TPR) repeat protein